MQKGCTCTGQRCREDVTTVREAGFHGQSPWSSIQDGVSSSKPRHCSDWLGRVQLRSYCCVGSAKRRILCFFMGADIFGWKRAQQRIKTKVPGTFFNLFLKK